VHVLYEKSLNFLEQNNLPLGAKEKLPGFSAKDIASRISKILAIFTISYKQQKPIEK